MAGTVSTMTTIAPTRMLEIRTTRYGEMETVQISEDAVLAFPEGVPGFERHRRFALIEDPKLAPFCWLQSLHDPLVGFLVIETGLRRGERGTIVHVFESAPAYLVEFVDPTDGSTRAEVELTPDQIRHAA